MSGNEGDESTRLEAIKKAMLTMGQRKGFTLIELLIVIAIIGILASIVLVPLSSARTKAKEAKVKSELKAVSRIIEAARIESDETLMEITTTGCSDCPCRTGDLRGVPDTHLCQVGWDSAMAAIDGAIVGGASGMSDLRRDPWDSPYALDENEGESGLDPCAVDRIRSAGPDGILQNADDTELEIPMFSTPAGC